MIGSASQMLGPGAQFGKRENVVALHRDARPAPSLQANGSRECVPDVRPRKAIHHPYAETWIALSLSAFAKNFGGQVDPRNHGEELTPRPEFQALQPGGDADADLSLQAQRLQRDRIRGTAHQHVAADADAERRAALRAGLISGNVTGPKPRHR